MMDPTWRPFCFGDYQGVGDDSCYRCPIALMCDLTKKFRKKKVVSTDELNAWIAAHEKEFGRGPSLTEFAHAFKETP